MREIPSPAISCPVRLFKFLYNFSDENAYEKLEFMVNTNKPPTGKVILPSLKSNDQHFRGRLFQVWCCRRQFMRRIKLTFVEILLLLDSGPSLMWLRTWGDISVDSTHFTVTCSRQVTWIYRFGTKRVQTRTKNSEIILPPLNLENYTFLVQKQCTSSHFMSSINAVLTHNFNNAFIFFAFSMFVITWPTSVLHQTPQLSTYNHRPSAQYKGFDFLAYHGLFGGPFISNFIPFSQ